MEDFLRREATFVGEEDIEYEHVDAGEGVASSKYYRSKFVENTVLLSLLLFLISSISSTRKLAFRLCRKRRPACSIVTLLVGKRKILISTLSRTRCKTKL